MDIDLSLKNVVKRFGAFAAVKGVSFDIPNGQFISILGPSGCGKTTLLRMIAGFIEPSGGEILIDGKNMAGVPPNRRPVSLVFQNLALFPMMSVAQNIAFGLERRGERSKVIAAKVERMLETVGLPGFGSKDVGQLSGGQRQRVAIARCLVLEPAVLLLDEPLGALDLKLREQMKIELKKLQEEVGTTFLYITHDQSEALIMSNKVAVMNQGRIEQLDTPVNCYYQPKTPFVAGFIGESNRWRGKVEKVTREHVQVNTGNGISLYCKPHPDVKLGTAVDVFVRTEVISFDKGKGKRNRLDATLKNVLFDGASVRLLARPDLGGEEVVVALPQTPGNLNLERGNRLGLHWDASDTLCFPSP